LQAKDDIALKLKALEYCKRNISHYTLKLNANSDSVLADFKSTLPLLIVSPLQCNERIARAATHMKSEEQRLQLISQVQYNLQLSPLYLNWEETKFCRMIKFLCTIHNLYHVIYNINTKHPEIDQLLLSEGSSTIGQDHSDQQQMSDKWWAHGSADSGQALSDDSSLSLEILPNVSISDSDVNILMQMLALPQHDAVRVLRLKKGNLAEAFKTKLCTLKLNNYLLNKLLVQYALEVGLIVSNGSTGDAKHLYSTGAKAVSAALKINVDELKQLIENCKIDEFIKLVNSRFNEFFKVSAADDSAAGEKNKEMTELVFNLYLRQYLQLVKQSKYTEALTVVKQQLTPLAMQHAECKQTLESSLLLLALPQSQDGLYMKKVTEIEQKVCYAIYVIWHFQLML